MYIGYYSVGRCVCVCLCGYVCALCTIFHLLCVVYVHCAYFFLAAVEFSVKTKPVFFPGGHEAHASFTQSMSSNRPAVSFFPTTIFFPFEKGKGG